MNHCNPGGGPLKSAPMLPSSRARPFAVLLLSFAVEAAAQPLDAGTAVDPATLARLRDAAMRSDWAYQRLTELTDTIGPRLAGSPGAQAAVKLAAAALAAEGLAVTLQPVKVPHWVRGEERAELVEYAGRPQGVTQRVHLTALGGSSATPPQGLTAKVLVVHSVDEGVARAAEVKGAIVLVTVPFDQHLADNGQAGQAYRQAAEPRFRGPATLAPLGAAAVLVRSVGGADYRLPHTGATGFPEGAPRVPAAAVSAEDAALIERLAAKGPVKMKLTLTPQLLPEVDSHNVLGELRGSALPDEVVLVSGHLDAWDLGTGALDDGAGVTAAMGALQLIKSLGLQPRRTLRVAAWMNEENGVRGGKAYHAEHQKALGTHVAAIEADSGAGRPLGVLAYLPLEAMGVLKPVQQALQPLGATVLEHADEPLGADISPLELGGVPGFEPLLDGRSYFSYHHTAADTLDKVDPEHLRRQVAVLAVLCWFLSEAPAVPRPAVRALPPPPAKAAPKQAAAPR